MQWIGEIPSHWNVLAVKHFCNAIYAGGTPNTNIKEYWDGDIDWLPSGVCHDNRVCSAPQTITELGVNNSSTKFIPAGTALLAMTGATCGHTAFCEIDAYANQSVTAYLNNKKKLDSLFLWFLLQSAHEYILTFQSGGAQGGINVEQCKNLILCFPPLAEQKAIAKWLDVKCKKIDKLIATQQRRIELLQELRQSMITRAVTRGINPNAQLRDSGIEWIGHIPEHWEVMMLKRCAKIKTGCTPSTKEEKYYDSEDIEWFTPSDIGSDYIVKAEKKVSNIARKERACRMFPAKAVYFVGIGATIGKVSYCDIEASSNQQINAILPNSRADYKFITYCMKSQKEEILLTANTVTLPIINQERTGSLRVPIPPLDEQREIVAHIERETSKVDHARRQAERQIELLQELRQSVITEVVTGKRKVC